MEHFANSSGGAGSVSWTLNEQDGNKVIVYNSNFAKFANAKVPTGKVNITGIFKRFNNNGRLLYVRLTIFNQLLQPKRLFIVTLLQKHQLIGN